MKWQLRALVCLCITGFVIGHEFSIIERLQSSFHDEDPDLLVTDAELVNDPLQETGGETASAHSTVTTKLPDVKVEHPSTESSGAAGANHASTGEKDEPIKADYVPLYGYFNAKIRDHLYTTNPNELGRGKGDWEYDGIVGLVSATPGPDLKRLNRYLNLNTVDHFYSTEVVAESDIIKNEGFEGYVSEKEEEGMVQLTQLVSADKKDHMLVTVSSHPTGYVEDKVLGWVQKPLDKAPPPSSKTIPEIPIPYTAPHGSESATTANGTAATGQFWKTHPVDARLQPVFRYWNGALRDHFYTMSFDLLGNGRHGWRYQGIQMYIHTTQVPGTVPLYRYWNLRMGDHFYTTDYQDLGEGKDGYRFKGILGYVHADKAAHTIPLFRYFNKNIADHFYTTSALTVTSSKMDWAEEGIACYVYAVPDAEDAAKEITDPRQALLVPLYRYWNRRFYDHFYTTVWNEVQVGTHGWEFQGVQALVYSAKAPDSTALHRYWNIRTLDHFYTTNFDALGKGGENGWHYEGVECYVDVFRKPDNVPLYRYYNSEFKDHFYTTKWLGRTYKGWEYEGLQAYVHRRPKSKSDDVENQVKAPEGMVPVYRYWSADARDHLFTTNYNELKTGNQGYALEGVEMFVWRDAGNGVALHRYYNTRVRDHFYTTNINLLKSGGEHGWKYEGILGYVKEKETTGTVPLFRYYNRQLRDHFYTISNMGKSRHGYDLQGTAAFVVPHTKALTLHATDDSGRKIANANAIAVTTPLFKYYNKQTRDHFYTTDFAKLGHGKNGWDYLGKLGDIFTQNKAGYHKVRQYFSPSRRDHRYTIRHLRGGDWKFEGVIGYLAPSRFEGGVAVHDFEDKSAMDNALTTNISGPKTGGNYQFIETLGYLKQSQ